eukprot:8230155-Ditylum_brightwellii.AAC.1
MHTHTISRNASTWIDPIWKALLLSSTILTFRVKKNARHSLASLASTISCLQRDLVWRGHELSHAASLEDMGEEKDGICDVMPTP